MPSRRKLADAVRILAMDAVDNANSGHPGAPMGMADMAEALWRHGFRHNPAHPQWANRDRFVLSNGHASMLLYAVLHLTGYDLTMEDIRHFRTLHSRTPGHPEYGVTPGVEMTTGPLGQGIATAVGMALAEHMLAARFNRPGFDVIDHRTYVFLGDGCMMEGVASEACSLAGTLGLGKLIALYDANGISIDGQVDGWFTEDVAGRFAAYGWQVIRDVDGHDAAALDAALDAARAETAKPSLIICRTQIGFGSPHRANTAKAHGSPMGAEESAAVRQALGWEYPPFEIPADIVAAWDAREAGAQAEAAWNTLYAAYAAAYADLAAELQRRLAGELPAAADELFAGIIASMNSCGESLATRVCSQRVLEALVPALPELVGGSADLTGSVGTKTKASVSCTPACPTGNYVHYGVREFAMGAVMNGLALHGGIIPYAGTFLMFSDYARNAIRLAALMRQRVIWVLTHDSIGVGEDGPTHQPVEQVPSLRLIPGCTLWRPCDAVETAVAWKCALTCHQPSGLALSRQKLPFMTRTAEQIAAIEKGAYILRDCEGTPEAVIIATGSEVALAVGAYEQLRAQGRRIRVVSMPCTEVFDAQDAGYREFVLPSAVRARVAVEAAAAEYWYKYVGLDGRIVGMTSFGESAPGEVLAEFFGFTVERVVAAVQEVLS